MSLVVKATEDHSLIAALRRRLQASNISNPALVFTFFCDVVTQHGGEVWLGNVIRTLARLNINERGIRTAVFRLVKDGWLSSRKQGRRSYYRLSDTGQRYYQRAARRIYASDKPQWGNQWMLVFVTMVPEDKRDALHRGLSWLGYGRLATAVYALPGHDREPLAELLADLDIEDNIVHMHAHADGTDSLKQLVLSRWNLDDLQQRYAEYIGWLAATCETLENHQRDDPQVLLLLRVLLIHEYRRILLADPELPAGMLPSGWKGESATALTAAIYHRLYPGSTKWFEQQLQDVAGKPGATAGKHQQVAAGEPAVAAGKHQTRFSNMKAQ